ncbi:ADP-glyceromanno-heptose 6-epimerase [Candidatus Nitrospira inopinata]|uniref:ADP-L-glycero-D-manno-heptose-6-epimerase n=1 Tax=Candidatus Nitrospira inopinata TaxID=1715989 RepID=A0A0S4KLQ1_9BACT|nr:ADP-glyceromanno-heptose 6-epimerase [Candidatus Nitrospira inopinata]CUQ65331.1 ADP-L-glycero-D-manno-heptose-6-epimerase [Candidatus Nitrospira inopinata]
MSRLDEKSRVLVTGGAGFIGSALVWGLNRRGCDRLVLVDRLRSADKWRHLGPLRFQDYLEADELLPRLLNGSLGKFDIVLHMGACSSTTERDVAYLIKNNFEFTKFLCHWALETGARFIYASSAATYGDGSGGMSDTDPDLDRLRPLNAYGFSKQLFDRYAWRAGVLDRIVGLKYFNVFGPNEDHKGDMRSVVNKATAQAQAEGTIRLFKSYRREYQDGEQQRDFLYVKDAVAMTLYLADHPTAAGLFNIGSGEAHTWKQLALSVFRALGKEPKIEFIDMPEDLRSRYQYYTKADIGKLRATGYDRPMISLDLAVRDYVSNYLVPDRVLDPSTDTFSA